jgi:phosphopantothenoylcysteine decarboxylase/phosphopantothenate--cysteine ligase
MSPAATHIIHPDALWFATGHQPICELTGETEHIKFCGQVKHPADLYLISPCSANTISKIAHGIDDTTITTFATTAIGSKIPVVIVPAMHQSMYNHFKIQQNINLLQEKGVVVIEPLIEANKAKMALIEQITNQIFQLLGPQDFKMKNILVIGGSTTESIDAVRSICNTSSGKTALALSTCAYRHGASVELWYGQSAQPIPTFLKNVTFFTSISDVESLARFKDFSYIDILIVCAALSDYIPVKTKGKLPSTYHKFTILCHSAPKILPILCEKASNSIIVAYKLEYENDVLLEKAKKLQETYNLDMVVANTVSSMNTDDGSVVILNDDGTVHKVKGTKTEISERIFSLLKEKRKHGSCRGV